MKTSKNETNIKIPRCLLFKFIENVVSLVIQSIHKNVTAFMRSALILAKLLFINHRLNVEPFCSTSCFMNSTLLKTPITHHKRDKKRPKAMYKIR